MTPHPHQNEPLDKVFAFVNGSYRHKDRKLMQLLIELKNDPKYASSRPAPSAPTDNGFDEQKFRDELSRYLYRYVVIPSDIQREVFERDIISCARGCVYPVPIDIATIRNQMLDALERDFKGRYVEDAVAEIRRFPESLRREVSE